MIGRRQIRVDLLDLIMLGVLFCEKEEAQHRVDEKEGR